MTQQTAQVVLVDDDSEALLSLVKALKSSGITAALHAATTPEQGIKLLQEVKPQVLVSDLSIVAAEGVESGFKFVEKALTLDATLRVVVLTGHGSSTYGIRALELGAANFLQKPVDVAHLKALIQDGITQAELQRERNRLLKDIVPNDASLIVGKSNAVQQIRELAQFAATTTQSVLITGETGTGKGLCALEIHRLSARATHRLVRYQPGFGTADLVSSDLFGHCKGAFTGAINDRKGLIAEADKGTFFLDEVDALPAETQVGLLGVLQEKKIRAVGSDRESAVDFRLISATNADLAATVHNGKFRADLFHRIAHLVIHIPPLRERIEDLPLLSEYILAKLQRDEKISLIGFESAVFPFLSEYSWPGNIRELEAAIEGAASFAQFQGRHYIAPTDFRLRHSVSNASAQSFTERVESYKQALVKEALQQCQGNQSTAAAKLGLDRSTLRRILGRG